MIRSETRARARALQLLYAWETQRNAADGTARRADIVGTGVAQLVRPGPLVMDRAEQLVAEILGDLAAIDRLAQDAAENWRLDRIAAVERNILRLGVHELRAASVPPKVAIDEAVQLAHWFGGGRAPGFVNGVLDRVARALGRL